MTKMPPFEDIGAEMGLEPLEQTLEARGRAYGKFHDNALITQELRTTFRATPNWVKLKFHRQLALDEIALKIARILSEGADSANKDSWTDIAGYATLAAREWNDV